MPSSITGTIRVLVVDDSAVMRQFLSELIASQAGLEVVGTAADAMAAREMIKRLNPDVLTLDVAMPKMDGLEFLERLMRLRPMPVVMVSAFTREGSETTLRALELGAVDFIGKPKADGRTGFTEYAADLGEKIRAARSARLLRPGPVATLRSAGGSADTPGAVPPSKPLRGESSPTLRNSMTSLDKILFVGASTGGTEALKQFLLGMPADCPPILIVQHMPETFTGSFARRLDSLCAPRVLESQGGERLEVGTVYIAPGHSHLTVRRQAGGGFVTELHRGEPVNRHRPSVDVLFHGAAEQVGRQAVGVILTGMGKDGAAGLLAMRKAGAHTYGQDEASCVVYGMPREAALIGAVDEVVSLDMMAKRVLQGLGRQ